MSLARAERGIVYAEFLISFLPFFLLFVGTLQLGLIAVARIVVKHAAVQAVRAAVVAIDDDPFFDEDSATQRKHVSSTGQAGDARGVRAALGLVSLELPGLGPLEQRGCDRLQRIRGSAYVPLATLSPSLDRLASWLPALASADGSKAGDSVEDVLASPWQRVLAGFAYDRVAAAITFPEEPGSETLLDPEDIEFEDDAVVTVRVTYLYSCNVPLARDLVCGSLPGMSGIPKALHETLSALKDPSVGSIEAAYHTWAHDFPDEYRALKRDLGELAQAQAFVLLLPLLMQPSERFAVLRAEASLPNQGAAYQYASELCKTKKKLTRCEEEGEP
jgi:hypothetical protein